MYAVDLDNIAQNRVNSCVLECSDLGYEGRWNLVLQEQVAHMTYERGDVDLTIEWDQAKDYIEREGGTIRVTRGGYGLQFKANAGSRMLWTWRQLQVAKRDPAYISKVRTISRLKLTGGIIALLVALVAGNSIYHLITTFAPTHTTIALIGTIATTLPGLWLIRRGWQDRRMATIMRQISAAHYSASRQRVMRRTDALI